MSQLGYLCREWNRALRQSCAKEFGLTVLVDKASIKWSRLALAVDGREGRESASRKVNQAFGAGRPHSPADNKLGMEPIGFESEAVSLRHWGRILA